MLSASGVAESMSSRFSERDTHTRTHIQAYNMHVYKHKIFLVQILIHTYFKFWSLYYAKIYIIKWQIRNHDIESGIVTNIDINNLLENSILVKSQNSIMAYIILYILYCKN